MSPWSCFENKPHCLTQFLLRYHVTTRLAFQGTKLFWVVACGIGCASSQLELYGQCVDIVLALTRLWECDIIGLPDLPIFIFWPTITHHTREALTTCPAWSHDTFHLHEQPVQLCPWSSPPLNPKPTYMLHLFLSDLRCHGPTKLEITHPCAGTPDLSELLKS